jgi:RimJ/RimL family protein N-acetyltransferase
MVCLRTRRLTLSSCSPTDRDDFMALELDPDVMRFLNGGHAVDHSQNNSDATFLMPRGIESSVWTARRMDNGGFVGWFCLWPEGDRLAELGYRLRRQEWGRGLASEGAQVLVNWGFASGLYDRIFTCTMAVNIGSRRVMEKIGLTYARTVYDEWPDPIPGSELGEVKYEATRETWKGR